MKMRNKIVGGLAGLAIMASSGKAENMPDEKIVRSVGVIQEYLQNRGYSVGIDGTNVLGKDFYVGVDQTTGSFEDPLEPKILMTPMKGCADGRRFLLFYDVANEEDFKAIDEKFYKCMSYAMLGTEDVIKRALDRHFQLPAQQKNALSKIACPEQAKISGMYDAKGRKISTAQGLEKSLAVRNWKMASGEYFSREKSRNREYATKIINAKANQ